MLRGLIKDKKASGYKAVSLGLREEILRLKEKCGKSGQTKENG